jgi:Skp family chaperone for outer membrane proteins
MRALPLLVLLACAHVPRGSQGAPIDIGVVNLQWVLLHVQDGVEARTRLKALVAAGEKDRALEEEQLELKRIFAKMDPVLQRIAQAHGLRFVIETTDGGVLYAVPEIDLSRELAAVYDGKGEVEPESMPRQTTDSVWVDDTRSEAAPVAALVFGKRKSGLTYAVQERAAGQGNGLVAVVDVTKFGPVFTPLDLERRQTALQKVAGARGLALIVSTRNMIAFTVQDVTDDVIAALPPGGPVSQ